MNFEDDDDSIDSKDLKTTKIEYIQSWIANLFLRILNEFLPLLISIILALLVAIISSNFDHLMKLLLETIDSIGYFKYLTSIICMVTSTFLVHVFHPTVRGSGIPEMKLFLDNWESPKMKDYLSFKALITKIIGLGFAILSGFPVGKEGPFVHISCSISYLVKFRMVPKITEFITYNYRRSILLSRLSLSKTVKQQYVYWKLHYLRDVDIYRFMCTGCALGVACTFGAPIGGVMYSIEVTSQIFDISNYWHCFFTGMVGALFFRFFIGGVFHETWYFKPFLKSNLPGEEYEFYHFLVYIGIGVACGIMGSIFILIYYFYFKAGQIYYRILNYLLRKLSTKNNFVYLKLDNLMGFYYSFRLGMFHPRTSPRRIVVTVIFTLSITFALCIGEFIQNRDFQMPLSQHSQLTLFFDDGRKLLQDFHIKSNLNMTSDNREIDLKMNFHNYFKPLLLFLLMKILFFIPIVTCLPVPRGIFFPLMVIGACLGRILGDFTNISSAGCAIVGAAGLSGAVTHSVSTAVIITEMTEEIQYLLPCAIAAFIGKLIVQIIAKYSIYTMIMRNRHMPYMPDEDERSYPYFKKSDASSFFTSGNYISMNDKISEKKSSLVLYYNLNIDTIYTSNDSSTNGQLRSILSIIQNRKSEMQWKLIPVMRNKETYEALIGYIRCEAATYYLQKHFESINGCVSTNNWWLKDPVEIINSVEKNTLLKSFLNFFGNKILKYNPRDWESFLNDEINWMEILEEKPCSVTLTTRLPDIQTFIQKNFLPQVFVLDGADLCGVITRENIIEQMKLLHRQTGTLAVSYRVDLQSLPMQIRYPDQMSVNGYIPKILIDDHLTSESNFEYVKLRTHSE